VSELATSAASHIAGLVWDESASGIHTTSNTFGQRLQPIYSGTASAGAAGTITFRADSPSAASFFNNTIIHLTSGTGSGQSRIISDFASTC
jgi:hypothetical protein